MKKQDNDVAAWQIAEILVITHQAEQELLWAINAKRRAKIACTEHHVNLGLLQIEASKVRQVWLIEDLSANADKYGPGRDPHVERP